MNITLIEPSSSLPPSSRLRESTALTEDEGLGDATIINRLVAFSPRQLRNDRNHDHAEPGNVVLTPLLRVGPTAVAWSLLLAQVVWRGIHDRRRTGACDVVYSLSPQAGALGVVYAKVTGRPLVCRLQTDVPETGIRRAVSIGVLRRADLILAISSFTRDVAVTAGVSRERIEIRPPAIAQEFLGPSTDRATGRSFTVGYVGRLEREKGPEDALHAFADTARDGWRLRIVGRGRDAESLRATAHRLGIDARIEWLEWVPRDQLPAIVDGLDCLLVPTRVREGLGRVAIEALLRGVPVVGYASGGLPEACGGGALLVPPYDASALADALEQLGSDPELRQRLADAGREHARELAARSRQPITELIDAAICSHHVVDP